MRHLLILRSIAHYLIYRELAVVTALKFRLAAGRFRKSITKRLSGLYVAGMLLHSFRRRRRATRFLESYTSRGSPSLTIARPTGGSFSRLVILSFGRERSRGSKRRKEKKCRARTLLRRGDRNRILRALRHRRRISKSRIAVILQSRAARWPVCDVTRYFRFEKDDTRGSSSPSRVTSRRGETRRFRWVALGRKREKKREDSASSRSVHYVAERTNPKITL